MTDPPKSGQPLYSERLTCSDWFYHRTNTFWASEKQTPLNSKQWILISPRRTFKITLETRQWSYSHIMQKLVDCFRNTTITGLKTEHYISTVVHRAGLSRQCKAIERSEKCDLIAFGQSHITTPTGSIPNAYNRYLHISDPQRWSFPVFSQI